MSIISMIIYAIIFYLISVILMMSNQNPADYIDGPSIVPIFCGILMTFVSFGPVEFFKAFIDALFIKPASDKLKAFQMSFLVISSMGNYIFLFCLITFLLGVVQAMGLIEDTAMLSTGIAVALMPILYGCLVKFVILHPLAILGQKKALLCEGLMEPEAEDNEDEDED